MTPLHALVLGIIQGLAEFLPISSSGHLLIVPHLLGWEEQPLAFDVALHIGTLTTILVYFRRDWIELVSASLRDLAAHGLRISRWGAGGKLMLLIALGTVPAVLVGLGLSNVEERLRTPGVVAAMLVLVSGVMAAAERWSARHPHDEGAYGRLTPRRVLLVGIAQACALVPGVSRSGATISAGMFAGLGRATAARFSFLLATPVTLAAAVKELPELRHASDQGISLLEIGIGISASLVVGVAAITLLLRYLQNRTLFPFIWYRVVLAAVIVATLVR